MTLQRILLALACAFFLGHANVSAQVVESNRKADLLIVNANVITCDAIMSRASAIAIREGRIVAIGDSKSIEIWRTKDTTTIDAQGKHVTPGLIDSHLHFVGLGQSLQMLDFSQAKSWDECVAMVQASSWKIPKGTWIEGRGWHQSKWDKTPDDSVDGYPHHRSLSDAVPDHPVLMIHASGHAAFANQAAMKAAGINRSSSDPEGGEILKDATGEPLGVFRENAQNVLRSARMKADSLLTKAEQREAMLAQIRLAGDACLQNGITSVHDAGISFEAARQLKSFAAENQLPVRMRVMIRESSDRLAIELPKKEWDESPDPFLSIRSIKVSMDGALGPHGAWLLEPYDDLSTSRGLNTVSLDELRRIALLCKQHEWQLCVHAIGDRANQEVLNVYEQVLGTEKKEDRRWRIEHAQHLAIEDISRFAKLGIIPAMQANHCTSDASFVPTRLGMRRSQQGAYVWRLLIDAGSIIPNGTDAPVERVDPRASLYAAVTRRFSKNESFFPEQCMTRDEAMRSYTIWPAIASFQETQLGSIEVGKLADIVVWDTDLVRCEPDAILNATVAYTIINGKVVYQRP